MGIGYRESCRESFKELKILTLSSQYISLCYCLLFIIGVTVPQIVYIIALTPDKKNDLHLPQVSLIVYQKGVFYSAIQV